MDTKSATPIEEDISVLCTTWFPSSEEASAIKSRSMARKEMVREIDEEIASLRAQRCRLVKACDVGGTIMAPIRKLPVALLTAIFIKCIPSFPAGGLYANSIGRPRNRGSYLHPQDVGGLLGSVCRAWETIVNAEPRIWSSIIFDRQIRDPEDIQRLLMKSKSHPLDILIQPCYWFPADGQNADNFNAVFSMIRSELWRIRILIADMYSHVGGGVMFPQDLSTNAPMMQKFMYIRTSTRSECRLGTFHGPQLCSLVIQNSGSLAQSFVGSPMQTVRRLEVRVTSGPMAPYFHLLSVLPNLVSLYWCGTESMEQVQEALPTVTLHSVTFLRLHIDGSAINLLSFLHVPSLESLELLVDYHTSPTVSEVIGALCGDGVVKLRRLHIVQSVSPQPNVDTMLRQLNCLKTLIIEASAGLDDLFSALSPQDRDFSSVCPQLTQLVIIKSKISPGPFVDFVHRRTRADWEEAAPGHVTSLQLGIKRDRQFKSTMYSLGMYLARTHSAALRFLSTKECASISLVHLDSRHTRIWLDHEEAWDSGSDWEGEVKGDWDDDGGWDDT